MSEYVGQDNGTLRVTIREAAARLGVTEAAVRTRIQRGALGKGMGEDGRVYVYLDLSQDVSQPESQVHRNPLVEELVEELRDRVAFLKRSLERRSFEAERYQQIVAGLTQTNNQLATRPRERDAPWTPSHSVEEYRDGAEPRSNTEGPQEATERPGTEEEEPRRRSWWREFFGIGNQVRRPP